MRTYTLMNDNGRLKFSNIYDMCDYMKMITDKQFFPICAIIVEDTVFTKFGPSTAYEFFFEPLRDWEFRDLLYHYQIGMGLDYL